MESATGLRPHSFWTRPLRLAGPVLAMVSSVVAALVLGLAAVTLGALELGAPVR